MPKTLLDEALALAQYAPSNSNIQPWFVVLATGDRLLRLKKALLLQAQQQQPNIPALPAAFEHYRRELGAQVYGAMRIAREDRVLRRQAVLRNYEFFGASVGGIICMHRELSMADALSVGMYLQTLVLSLTARGLDTCVQVSIAGYLEIIRTQLDISSELLIICGLAIGYGDQEFPANCLRIGREAVEKNVIFLDH